MPDGIRTRDLQSRSLTLYPAELRTHNFFYYNIILLYIQYLILTFHDSFCRFVNDVLQKRLKEFAEIDKRVDVVNGSFPIKRTHREFIVVLVMHL